jgi:hypothetical protein
MSSEISTIGQYKNLYNNYNLDQKDFSTLNEIYLDTLDQSVNQIAKEVIESQRTALQIQSFMPALKNLPYEELFAKICEDKDRKHNRSTPESYQKFTDLQQLLMTKIVAVVTAQNPHHLADIQLKASCLFFATFPIISLSESIFLKKDINPPSNPIEAFNQRTLGLLTQVQQGDNKIDMEALLRNLASVTNRNENIQTLPE